MKPVPFKAVSISPVYHEEALNIYSTSIMGFFLGFVFGVGCALAVMYSIFLGGYRAAIRDAALPEAPERLVKARSKAANSAPSA